MAVTEGTSCSCAGVERQIARSSPEDLLLGFWPLFLFIALFFSLWQAKLELGEGSFLNNRQLLPTEMYRHTVEVFNFGGPVPLWKGLKVW